MNQKKKPRTYHTMVPEFSPIFSDQPGDFLDKLHLYLKASNAFLCSYETQSREDGSYSKEHFDNLRKNFGGIPLSIWKVMATTSHIPQTKYKVTAEIDKIMNAPASEEDAHISTPESISHPSKATEKQSSPKAKKFENKTFIACWDIIRSCNKVYTARILQKEGPFLDKVKRYCEAFKICLASADRLMKNKGTGPEQQSWRQRRKLDYDGPKHTLMFYWEALHKTTNVPKDEAKVTAIIDKALKPGKACTR